MFLHQLAKKLCAVFYPWACLPSILTHSLDLLNSRDVFRLCALHKEKAGACTETAMPGVQGKEMQPLDRASPFPIHVLNWALVFGQYLILDLKDVWCVQFIYLGGIKFSAAPIYSLNVFLQESPLIPDPWNFWVVFFPALTELYPVMFVFPPSWLSFQVFDSSFS